MNKLLIMLTILSLASCSSKETTLPILGEKVLDPVSGRMVDYQAPVFELTNQLNEVTSNRDFANKIQVIDFFFTSCPTICPKMTTHLKVVEEAFAEEEKVAILSYTIDAKHDTLEKLLEYAERYDINNEKWSFLTGDRNYIFELAKDYKVRAFDDSFPGEKRNLFHDGTFILVDGARRIRGYYDGLKPSDVKRLINDIHKIL